MKISINNLTLRNRDFFDEIFCEQMIVLCLLSIESAIKHFTISDENWPKVSSSVH